MRYIIRTSITQILSQYLVVADFTPVPHYLMSVDFNDPISHEKFPAADITNLRDASTSKKSADST